MPKDEINGDYAEWRPGYDTIYTSIWYPTVNTGDIDTDNPSMVQVGLIDVRAADDIRVSYDHARDGWVIEQPRFGTWASDEEREALGEGWVEVGFHSAWAMEDAAHKARVTGDDGER